SVKQLEKALTRAIHAYNTDRPHDALMGKTPVEFEAYIKELPIQNRPVLEIFTFEYPNDSVKDPMQLSIEFNL
ncbi:MAG: integrase core domain-containing protein, partial [Bacteroidia bacterium]